MCSRVLEGGEYDIPISKSSYHVTPQPMPNMKIWEQIDVQFCFQLWKLFNLTQAKTQLQNKSNLEKFPLKDFLKYLGSNAILVDLW